MENEYSSWLATWPEPSLALLAEACAGREPAKALATTLTRGDDRHFTALRDELMSLLDGFQKSDFARRKLARLQSAIDEVCRRRGAPTTLSWRLH